MADRPVRAAKLNLVRWSGAGLKLGVRSTLMVGCGHDRSTQGLTLLRQPRGRDVGRRFRKPAATEQNWSPCRSRSAVLADVPPVNPSSDGDSASIRFSTRKSIRGTSRHPRLGSQAGRCPASDLAGRPFGRASTTYTRRGYLGHHRNLRDGSKEPSNVG